MAAVEADRVVIALIGDTRQLDAPVSNSAVQYDRNMSKIEAAATRAERQIIRSTAVIANGQRNLGRQFADVGTQLAGGQSSFLILAQQLPQVADAAVDMGGKLGRVASFLTNPWGAAALAATSVLVPLVAGLFKTGNEVDALVEKMRTQARQADLNREADARWKVTIEGLTEAIRKRREEQEKSFQTDQQAEQESLAAARRELANLTGKRNDALVELSRAEKAAQEARRAALASGDRGDIGISDQAESQAAAARKRLADIEATIRKAVVNVRGQEIPIGEREVEHRIDAVAAATDRYIEAQRRLRDERKHDIITQKQYNEQLEIERRKRDAAVKAAEAARNAKPDADTVPFLRPVQGGTIRGTLGEKRPGHTHAGVDIAVPVGTSVSAAAAGTVIESGTLPGYGNVIFIDHGRGTITRYAHLSQLNARKGDVVSAGDVIGLSGGARGAAGSGNSQGPHLHYEVRRNGRPVDPNGGAFPIDPATARTVRDKVQDDFDKLFDDLQRDSQQATDKITSDFEALEGGMDPAAKIAAELDDTIGKIERARLIGIVDDTRALELQMKATHKAAADLLGDAIHIDDLRAAGEVEKGELNDADDKRKAVEDRLQQQREDNIYELANLYETLFTGGVSNLWDEFERQGLRALAKLAAQETFKAIASLGLKIFGGGDWTSKVKGSNDALGLDGLFGRASGGYVGPGSIHRVNEHAGGVELLRMGPQGGEIIPLGQTRASAPQSGGSSRPAVVQIMVDEGAAFVPRVQAISGDVSIQVVRSAAPQIVDAATARTVATVGRPRL